jgi:hypothetical protein
MTAVYHIGVQGHLDVDWSEEFAGLTIIHQSDGSSPDGTPLPRPRPGLLKQGQQSMQQLTDGWGRFGSGVTKEKAGKTR